MVNSFIQLPDDGTGKKTRTNELNIGGHDVHQQIVEMSDNLGNTIIPANEATQVANQALLQALKDQNDLLRVMIGLLEGVQSGRIVDTLGRQNVVAIQATAASLNMTASIAAAQTLATVTTVGSLTNLNALVPSSNLAVELSALNAQQLHQQIVYHT